MRVFKALMAVLIIGGIIFLSVSCGGKSSSDAPATQTTTVKRGNITISVTGTGNLALEDTQELSFGQTGLASQASTAKISAVNVVAGQTVKQGQVLVTADPTDWQDQITTDQHNLDSALASVAQAKSSVAQAQANVTQAQQNLIQDQANLVKAQQNLSSQQDVQKIQNQINNANIQLQLAQLQLQQAMQISDTSSIQYWRSQINYLSVNSDPGSNNKPDGGEIGILQKEMSNLLTDPANAGASLVNNVTDIPVIQQDVLAVQQAQAKIVTDQANLVTAQANVTNAQNNVVLAQNKADDSQTTLTNDQNSAQEIVAPFDGLITQVNVSQGQIVQRSATLVEIADPNKWVASIMVNENNLESVKTGDNATVSFNAISGLTLPGKITQIAPLATITQGVVNYQVTVELTSITPVFPTRTGQSSSQSTGTRTFPTSLPDGSPLPTSFPNRSSSGGTSVSRSGLSAASQNFTLRDGLSVVVTIPTQTADNVLILPSRAITRTAQGSTVKLIKGTTTQTVTVQTGLTDGLNTEIVSGLSEGEQVLLPAVTSSSTSTNSNRPGGGGFLRVP